MVNRRTSSQIHIQCLGLNHLVADINLREKLAFTPLQLETALSRLSCGDKGYMGSVHELVILSTCNRVELYAVGNENTFDALFELLVDIQGLPRSEIEPVMYQLDGQETIDHLFRVAAGLDSMVLGEPQILGQVTDALSLAQRYGTSGKILSRLFQQVINAGKRTHTETRISQNPASISSVAIQHLVQVHPDLHQAQITILGAGEMAELAVEALRKRGACHIYVLNRTLERARHLAERWQGQAGTLEKLSSVLENTDILITSTSAPHTLINVNLIERVMQTRNNRPLAIVDIAVPRDVELKVGSIPGVSLFDIDNLYQELGISLNKRSAEVPQVEAIIAEEQAYFQEFLGTLDVLPLITEMRRRAEKIRQDELDKTVRHLSNLSPQEVDQIEAMTKAIIKKILHQPTARLREVARGPQAVDYAAITRGLFGIDTH